MGRNAFEGDDEKADHHKSDSQNTPSGEDFSDKQNSPYLCEEWGGAGDGIDEGEISLSIGFDKTDKVNGFKKAGGDDQPPEFRWGLDEERGKDTKGDEEWKIEQGSPEKHPEKEFEGPVSLLGQESSMRSEEGLKPGQEECSVVSLCSFFCFYRSFEKVIVSGLSQKYQFLHKSCYAQKCPDARLPKS